MHVSAWFEILGGFFYHQNPWYTRGGGEYDNKDGDLNWAHALGLGYNRGSDNTKSEITEVKV